MSRELIAAIPATVLAFWVFVRIFMQKFGLIFSLRAAFLTWVIAFAVVYLGLGLFGGWVRK